MTAFWAGWSLLSAFMAGMQLVMTVDAATDGRAWRHTALRLPIMVAGAIFFAWLGYQ